MSEESSIKIAAPSDKV